jgi:Fe-S cluster assembly protein SufD
MKYTITKDEIKVRVYDGGDIAEDFWVENGANLTVVYKISGDQDTKLVPSIHLMGDHTSATVVAMIETRGKAKTQITTLQHHVATNTTSNLLVKCVLREDSISVYEGSIRVEKEAQKTDAYQRNENLLLDEESFATSKPALEILANDVRCTHGAIVKTLSADELWYMATRGIGTDYARDIIADGFLQSALTLITDTTVRQKAEEQLS